MRTAKPQEPPTGPSRVPFKGHIRGILGSTVGVLGFDVVQQISSKGTWCGPFLKEIWIMDNCFEGGLEWCFNGLVSFQTIGVG